MDDIIDILDLEDQNAFISDITIEDDIKYVTLETKAITHYCPVCSYRMHSRGIKTRTIRHPILQDTYRLVIKLKQRRWKCTNPICGYEFNEDFNFVNKYRRTTNATDLLIVNSFRDLSRTARSIAEQFNTSDTHVIEVFQKYVRMERLPLTDAICVDEVYLDMDAHCKYALVIQDFHTGQTIDLVRSRRNRTTEPFFSAIPREERFGVKYLITDMYNPYLAYVEKYFPYATSVVDSFHVMQWIIHRLNDFIQKLIKEIRYRDKIVHEQRELEAGRPLTQHLSDELYLLQKYRWLLLMNQDNITMHYTPKLDKHFRCLMNSYDYEDAFFAIHPDLRPLRDLKEEYARFNNRNAGNPQQASLELDALIDLYFNCGYEIFEEFAGLLKRYHDPIIQSFVMVKRLGNGKLYDSRLSNGPIESLNRKIKDIKRNGRGYRNFEHLRNRFLFSTRLSPPLDGRIREEMEVIMLDD